MFATKSCAEIEVRMGNGVVGLPSSVMLSAPELSACHPPERNQKQETTAVDERFFHAYLDIAIVSE